MNFIKLKKLITKLLIIVLLIIPKYSYAYSKYVIPGGNTIGIEVNSKGVLVIDFYEVNNKLIAKESGFKINDLITEVENIKVESINDMVNVINNTNKSQIKFKVKRNNITKEINLKVNNEERGILKTGLYVKDKINGIGTLSYIDPTTKIFASLGHEIIESKTKQKFEIKDGSIYEATVSNITKSEIGKAGEKNAVYNKQEIYGQIYENEESGIYGKYLEDITNKETIEIAEINQIKLGKAIIKTVINDNLIEDFTINILKINKDNSTKNILFEITDERLLKETGGIVQGMSGSPIIQDNKLIGAVNYVVVNDPKKGYGIFITTMLEEGEN